MNAKHRNRETARRKAINQAGNSTLKRNGLDQARDFTVSFVRQVLADQMGSDDEAAYINITDLVHDALFALEEAHPELGDMPLFMQIKKWSEGEVLRVMNERGFVFDYPVTHFTFSRVESE